MKCEAISLPNAYRAEPRPCAKRHNIKPHRFGKLCPHHREYVERHRNNHARRNLCLPPH